MKVKILHLVHPATDDDVYRRVNAGETVPAMETYRDIAHAFGERIGPVVADVLAGKVEGLSYVHAADVETFDRPNKIICIDEAFQLTNTIHDDWTKNDNVKATMKSRRSTSVGDIAELPDGSQYVCAAMGWEKLS